MMASYELLPSIHYVGCGRVVAYIRFSSILALFCGVCIIVDVVNTMVSSAVASIAWNLSTSSVPQLRILCCFVHFSGFVIYIYTLVMTHIRQIVYEKHMMESPGMISPNVVTSFRDINKNNVLSAL